MTAPDTDAEFSAPSRSILDRLVLPAGTVLMFSAFYALYYVQGFDVAVLSALTVLIITEARS